MSHVATAFEFSWVNLTSVIHCAVPECSRTGSRSRQNRRSMSTRHLHPTALLACDTAPSPSSLKIRYQSVQVHHYHLCPRILLDPVDYTTNPGSHLVKSLPRIATPYVTLLWSKLGSTMRLGLLPRILQSWLGSQLVAGHLQILMGIMIGVMHLFHEVCHTVGHGVLCQRVPQKACWRADVVLLNTMLAGVIPVIS
jgi:hypothetical protein